MRFKNPTNDYVETVDNPSLWSFLFGPFYFVSKGVWTHAVIEAVTWPLVVPWIVYAAVAGACVRTHYLRLGWVELPDSEFGSPKSHAENARIVAARLKEPQQQRPDSGSDNPLI